ncbi:erythrocyte membrane protein 1 [Plasmodium falciparum RAJ116]|uniref:Erythrocyte membrane protein 1 n=1 Tax=Plasmodium falciparum RAJ116 TaxID=580058 RepID=A0A0L0CS45_PLAFA|nr:erythrocyte membrane protein 1 [Plasmodium falciparum RAJ116]
MGANESSISKTVVGKETHMSARNVLENIGIEIYNEEKKKVNGYTSQLKGTLSKAQFLDGLYRATGGKVRPGPQDSCSLDHKFHTNINNGTNHGRNPCHGRKENRFGEDEGFECGSRIRDYNKKDSGTACAPFRRQNMCDKNLEFLDNNNTNTTDDLLGNVLVTAKYEGDIIVSNHPDKNNSNNKSSICTALARSFADIGDIIRGKDMFKPNEDVEKGLQVVFGKIYNSLTPQAKTHYADEDGSGNYLKLREAWWTANRNQVWRAITCKAPTGADYFKKKSDGTLHFSSQGQCGHTEGIVPTNFDYVPQFLRWFNEWAEEFCRIRKIKIDKTKEECIGENNGKNCSREGYDCNKTNLKLNEIFVDLDCPRCEKACTSYNEWIENKKKEFKKQKRKYEMEFNGTQSHGNIVNGNYYKTFYNELKTSYKEVNRFFDFLNKGKICENIQEKNKIDFNEVEKTFSRSQYCKSCPILGVNCENGQCNSFNDIPCPKIKSMTNIRKQENENPINIHILVNDNKKIGLSPDLKGYFNDCDIFKKLGQQKWNCKNKCNLDICELENFENGIDDERLISIEVLIKRWLKFFLNDYNQIKEKLNRCMNNEKKKELLCIKDCYKNCVCVGKWIKKKEEEWQNIKDRYLKRYKRENDDISNDLKTFLQKDLFAKYVKNALEEGENLHNLKELVACDTSVGSDKKQCPEKDVINILLNRLNGKIEPCKKQHEENKNNNSCKTLPPPLPRRRRRGVLRRGLRRVRVPRARQVVKNDRGLLVGQEEVKETAEEEVEEEKEEEETPEEEAEVERPGPTATPVPELPGPPAPKNEEACKIVDGILKGKDKNRSIENCKHKYDPNKQSYPKWDCTTSKIKTGEEGACMPPRRIKLCVINLKYLNEKISPEELRKAFIQCAAVETFLLWHKYKKDNNGGDADTKLNSGTIPEEFKRQMFYTFGDFRDLCLDKNIGNDVSDVEKNINKVFSDSTKKAVLSSTEDRTKWWQKHGHEIWKGMLCGLSHHISNIKETERQNLTNNSKYSYSTIKFSDDKTTLEEFAKRPQFLRWMTEWGEDFCKKQQKQYMDLVNRCTGCDFSNDGNCTQKSNCKDCSSQCTEYQKFITQWKGQWEKQSNKYKTLYTKTTNGTGSDTIETKLLEYLKKLNEPNGTTYSTAGKYINAKGYINDCAKSKQNNFDENKNGGSENKYAFKDYPNDHEKQCTCKPKALPSPHVLAQQPPQPPPPPPLPPPRPRAAGGSGHDHRGRSEGGENGVRPPVPVPQPAPPKQPAGEGLGRALNPRDPTDHEVEEEEEGEGDSDEEDEEEEPEETAEDTTEDTAVNGEGEAPKVEVEKVNPCEIVKELFKDTNNFSDACGLKYGKTAPTSWKCVTPSGPTSGGGKSDATTGGLCIPPRRRRLYVKKLHDWATNTVESTKSLSPPASTPASTSSPSNPRDVDLLKAFVESAAVETFFAWHKYKKDKEIEEKEKEEANGELVTDTSSVDEKHQKDLQSGKIPPDFLRLMFYTLGDYRDICVGNTPNGIDTVSASDQKDKEASSKLTMKQISDKIKEMLGKQSGTRGSHSGTDPVSWWNKHGPDIWNGMICALTYKDNTNGGPPTQINEVKEKLWDDTNKKPKPKTDGTNGKDYTYGGVRLEDENSGTQALSPGTSGEKTTLDSFIKRPPYFRYLEEWGQNFCKERKKRLEKIKVECTKDGYGKTKKCSGYGENCDDNLLDKKYDILPSFNCQSCGEECRKYRKWIERRKIEFEEQKSAYTEQQNKCQAKSDKAESDNGVCGTVKTCNTAGDFLERLKSGPCKNDSEEDNKGKGYIDFKNEGEAFGHENYCDPCPKFTVDCKNGNCDTTKGQECNGNNKNSIAPKDIKNSTDDLDMLVSDNNTNGLEDIFEECVLGDCADAGIFKAFRKDVWTCGKVCGYNVCKPKNSEGKKVSGERNGENQIILITAFVKHWVENFLEDYNKIRKKLNLCTKNDQESKCISGCKDKCKCVEKWINTKKEEWGKITQRLNEQYKNKEQHDYPVKTILEEFLSQREVNNAIGRSTNLNQLQDSKGCCVKANSGNSEKDAIDCMIEKLAKKAEKCKTKHSGEEQKPCDVSNPLVEDDDEAIEEENSVTQPNICPKPQQEPEAEDEDGCKPAAPAPATDSGIIYIYIYMWIYMRFVYMYVWKKTHTPVDLLRVINIPKSDYDIPTKLSPNRYIPYASSKYRGKRYIYIEGDSGTDSGYTDHYSDITSSSESEYEEMDINDLYPYTSPKYKTLIEVVLEPSKGNGNTLGDDMVPTTNTFTDEEWNELKHDFISQYVVREPLDIPQYDVLTDLPMNIGGNVLDDGINEKPFITSIHDRDLYTGEEYSYNIDMGTNSMDDTKYVSNNVYSGIDLINDTLSGNKHIDIYDEVLKRKENELFGTNHVKQTSIHSVAKLTNSDPIHNQLNLLHKWLDRHRDMCEKWNKKEELLEKLKEEWEQDNNSGDIRSDNHVMNTNVSIQIDIDENKGKKEFSNMDTILDDMEDDIYYDVNDDENPFVDDIPMDHNKVDVPKKVHVEMKILNNTSNGSLEPEFPISDVWNI